MLITDRPHTIYATAAKAQAVVDKLNADADGETYVLSVDPKGSGRAIIKVYDEDGNL